MRPRRVLASLALLSLLAACGGTATGPSSPAPSGSASSSASAPALAIPITIKGGQVDPNGQKITAKLGQTIVLRVTSDQADEIHAHTGGDGYELEVPANTTTTGSFTPTQPGSFEVESHHLNKIIVVLNVS